MNVRSDLSVGWIFTPIFFLFQKLVRNAAFGNFFGVIALFQSGRLVKVILLLRCLSVGVLRLAEVKRGCGEKD